MLGAAEAGFFPGIILFLTWWFPERQRTPALALFFTAVSVAYVFGGPISGGLLELDSFAGLDGWQWLFLIEGLPAIALGFVTLRFLDDSPRTRLADPGREFLKPRYGASELRGGSGPARTRRSGRSVWGYGLVSFVLLITGFGLTFVMPHLVQDRTGYTDFQGGRLAAIRSGSPPRQ
jgi:MFS family permease